MNNSPDPLKPLKNQKALITDANSGIGEACALALGAAGADVVVNYVSRPEEAERVVQRIRQSGTRSIAFQADVSQEDQVQAMFAEMLKEFGTIDILVNNAGLQRDSSFPDMTLEQWNTVIAINLTGQFLCARSCPRIPATRCCSGGFERSRQNHLHELGARSHPVGRPRQLRGVERWRHAVDERRSVGARAEKDSRE